MYCSAPSFPGYNNAMAPPTIHIERSRAKDKKYVAWWMDEDGKQLGLRSNFGGLGAEDYTMHHDEARKERYLIRHAGNPPEYLTSRSEDWTTPTIGERIPPGWLSRWLLWHRPSLEASAKAIRREQGIRIHLDPGLRNLD